MKLQHSIVQYAVQCGLKIYDSAVEKDEFHRSRHCWLSIAHRMPSLPLDSASFELVAQVRPSFDHFEAQSAIQAVQLLPVEDEQTI